MTARGVLAVVVMAGAMAVVMPLLSRMYVALTRRGLRPGTAGCVTGVTLLVCLAIVAGASDWLLEGL